MHFYILGNAIIPSVSLLPYDELIPNTSDGAGEKHVPVITVNNSTVTVTVGSVMHPMLEEHYITLVAIETRAGDVTGYHQKWLKPGIKPEAVFEQSTGEQVITAFEYCNLHGLWKSEM